MNNYVLVTLAIVSIILTGSAFLFLYRKELENLFGFLSLSFGIGAGIVGYYLYFLYLFKIRVDITYLMPLLPIWVLGLYNCVKYFKLNKLKEMAYPILLIIFFLIIAIMTIYKEPLSSWDARAIYGLQAKEIYYHGIYSFFDPSRVFFHASYPKLLPLLESYIFIWLGRVDDVIVHALFVGFYFSILLAGIDVSINKKLPIFVTLMLLFSLGVPPLITETALRGDADIIIGFFELLIVVQLDRFLDYQKWLNLSLAIVLSVFLIFTKNEGLALFIINSVLILILSFVKVKQKILTQIISYIILPAIFSLPWFLFVAYIPNALSEHVSNRITFEIILTHLKRIPIIFTYILKYVFISGTKEYGLLWYIFTLTIALNYKKIVLSLPLLTILIYFSVIFLIYIITPWPTITILDITFSRLILQIYPLTLLFIANTLKDNRIF